MIEMSRFFLPLVDHSALERGGRTSKLDHVLKVRELKMPEKEDLIKTSIQMTNKIAIILTSICVTSLTAFFFFVYQNSPHEAEMMASLEPEMVAVIAVFYSIAILFPFPICRLVRATVYDSKLAFRISVLLSSLATIFALFYGLSNNWRDFELYVITAVGILIYWGTVWILKAYIVEGKEAI